MPAVTAKRAALRALVRDAHAGWPARGGGKRQVSGRAALAQVLWSATGARRLPGAAELDAALENVTPSDLEWMFEFSPLAPVYFLPTRRWVQALARTLRELGVRRVLEVAAGDGFVARALARADPRLEVIASDSGAWELPEARMSTRERRELRATVVPGLMLGEDVVRMNARRAMTKFAPDLVLACWLPPGPLLDSIIRGPVQHVLEVGAVDGATPGAYSWRFAHEFCEGPLEAAARCRLDARPRQRLHTRVTHYFGARHPEHFEERVGSGHWLYQFKPVRT